MQIMATLVFNISLCTKLIFSIQLPSMVSEFFSQTLPRLFGCSENMNIMVLLQHHLFKRS